MSNLPPPQPSRPEWAEEIQLVIRTEGGEELSNMVIVWNSDAVHEALRTALAADLGLTKHSKLQVAFGGVPIEDDSSSFSSHGVETGATLFAAMEPGSLRHGSYILEGNQVDDCQNPHEYAAAVEIHLHQDESVSGRHLDGGNIIQGHWQQTTAFQATIEYEAEYRYGVYRYVGTTEILTDSGKLVLEGTWAATAINGDRWHRNIGQNNQKGNFIFREGGEDSPVSMLTLAAATGDVALVRHQLESGLVGVNEKNKAGSSALVEAAKTGQVEVMRFLLSVEGIDVNIADREFSSPLEWTIANDHLDAVELLLATRLDIRKGVRKVRGDPSRLVSVERRVERALEITRKASQEFPSDKKRKMRVERLEKIAAMLEGVAM